MQRGGDGHGVSEAECVEAAELAGLLWRVELVGDEYDVAIFAAEGSRDVLVEGHDALWGVDDEEDEGGLGDGVADLVFDVVGEVVDVLDAHAAGVDHFDPAPVELDGGGYSVSRDAGSGVDDGDPPPGKGVQKRALADVRPADDGDNGQGHSD